MDETMKGVKDSLALSGLNLTKEEESLIIARVNEEITEEEFRDAIIKMIFDPAND